MGNDLNVTWIGHSCFVIDDNDIKIMFDPYRPNSVPGLKDVPSIGVDKVFISHHHDDHDYDKIPCFLRMVDIKYETIDVAHDNENGALRGRNLIHIVHLNGYKIVHMGDIGCKLSQDQIEKLKGTDLLLIPINGFYTIGALDALEIFKLIKPKIMIPMHYCYNNTGYPDNNQIDILKSSSPCLKLKQKNINIKDFINDDSQIIILDDKGE